MSSIVTVKLVILASTNWFVQGALGEVFDVPLR